MSAESPKAKIYKPRPVTGFPEWLPEVRLVEQQWFDHIRRVFESYGFCSIETPSVEELDVLRAKGEVDKEIYVLERLHKDEDEKSDARLALHFDQTVPLARYVAQNFNDLVFPFKRYQMQRVWRGERPQKGRFREFYQCDIDVIGVDSLPLHFDAEMPAVMWEVMSGLPGMEGQKIQMRISNRKILFGFLKSMNITDQNDIKIITRLLDKLDKSGLEGFMKALLHEFKDDEKSNPIIEYLAHFVKFAEVLRGSHTTIRHGVMNIFLDTTKEESPTGTIDPQLIEGLNELSFVIDQLSYLPEGSVIADLSIVRGLDYYTGTVYETVFLDDPGYGSICSGGRYDDLAGSYINKHLPGVGISIGFSRLFARMVDQGKIDVSRKSPAEIMVMLPHEDRRAATAELCQSMRQRGLKVEMYHAAKKFPDQLKYASRKGIPYVWITEEDGTYQVKNMLTGEQKKADPATWTPDGKILHEAS
ncbi:MAG: histidine--tRNA ligase [Micavibrio sp.]